jgi:hypothetical protein
MFSKQLADVPIFAQWVRIVQGFFLQTLVWFVIGLVFGGVGIGIWPKSNFLLLSFGFFMFLLSLMMRDVYVSRHDLNIKLFSREELRWASLVLILVGSVMVFAGLDTNVQAKVFVLILMATGGISYVRTIF